VNKTWESYINQTYQTKLAISQGNRFGQQQQVAASRMLEIADILCFILGILNLLIINFSGV